MLNEFIIKNKYVQGKTTQRGFTLIETIVGIVLLSLAFSIFTSLIYPLSHQNAEQVHQIRAAELGQSMINEIMGKAFDDKSDMSGGVRRCGEPGYVGCTSVIGKEFLNGVSGPIESRGTFDDVDDYHGLNIIGSSLGDSNLNYTGFEVTVTVENDSNYSGKFDGGDDNKTAKLIKVTVKTPQAFDFVFSAYKANF